MSELRFDGRVAIVTGAARGLGREYALLLASRGAAVVINDLGGSRSGEGNSTAADQVVQEIRSKGGKAVADYNSVEEGHKIVKTAIDNFGRIDILINNAGILRDKSFQKITEQDWDLVHRVHLRGSFLVTKAAWPYFREQNYGRIIMTSSPAGIYGNFGQTNYSSAKLGLVGLSKSLAIEGAKYNIKCNSIAPVAASRLTEDILPQNLVESLKPAFVAPLVVWLSHESCPESGGLFETAGGFVGKYRWQRSAGKVFSPPDTLTPESIRDNWDQITDMNKFTSPLSIQEHTLTLANAITAISDEATEVPEVSSRKAIHRYNIDDAILYALSIGVSTREPKHLKFLYECSDDFSVIPSYGAVASVKAVFDSTVIQDALVAYNIKGDPVKAVHGEHYLEVINPIPSSGALVSEPKIIDVLDKGSGALLIVGVDTYDENGKLLFYNELAVFMVDAGNFGGKRKSDNISIKSVVQRPNRSPDATVYEQTSVDQAAIFRLCGDKNPLHIDPLFAAVGGFSSPILHGLCTLGYALRHVLRQFADYDVLRFKSIKTRFVGPLTPGQTIQTNMWKEGNRIHFECYIQETGKQIISGAYVDLIDPNSNQYFTGSQSGDSKLSEIQTENYILRPQVPTNGDILMETNNYFDNGMHLSSPSNSSDISFICAPYEGNDGGSDNGNGGRIDRIFGGWLYKRIKENKELVPIIKTVYQWNITKSGKIISVWTLDLKNGDGDVYVGGPKLGKPDCTLTIDEDCAINVFEGREDAMRAFMSGKLKITGNILAAQKLQQLWAEEAPKGSVSLDEEGDKPPQAPSSNANENTDDKALLDSVPVSGLKCDIVFTVFKNRMHEEPDLVRRMRVIFQFNITVDGKLKTIWTADNKNNVDGDVYPGPPKIGKPDCIVTAEDDDFLKLMVGKLNPQRAFMMGKLKIKGNIMLLQKLNSLWLDLQKAGKAPELPFLTDMMLKTSVIPGLKSESMIVELVQRLVRLPQLCTEVPTLIGFDITKDGNSVSQWTLDFTKNKLSGIFDRGLPDKKYCIFTIDDEDFVRLTFNRISLQNAIASGKVKVEGDKSIPQKISILFSTPTTRAKL